MMLLFQNQVNENYARLINESFDELQKENSSLTASQFLADISDYFYRIEEKKALIKMGLDSTAIEALQLANAHIINYVFSALDKKDLKSRIIEVLKLFIRLLTARLVPYLADKMGTL